MWSLSKLEVTIMEETHSNLFIILELLKNQTCMTWTWGVVKLPMKLHKIVFQPEVKGVEFFFWPCQLCELKHSTFTYSMYFEGPRNLPALASWVGELFQRVPTSQFELGENKQVGWIPISSSLLAQYCVFIVDWNKCAGIDPLLRLPNDLRGSARRRMPGVFL